MSAVPVDALQQARQLTLIGSYDRVSTRYQAFTPGVAGPVLTAEQRHGSAAEVSRLLAMLSGDGHTDLGRIEVSWTKHEVFATDGTHLGGTYRRKPQGRRRRWHFEQAGLPAVTGTLRGVRALLAVIFYDPHFEGFFFPFRFDFAGPGQAGVRR